ncbi:MAG: hypothetical protein E7277_09080 [Lachnospiraceae bacterium]|nr:hypothetical protein [Lachnospiraceae bacterium]
MSDANIYDDYNTTYIGLERKFYDGQAGILAETLKIGCPCPVCGSLEHPKPAVRAREVPTEQELSVAKKALEKARSKRDHSAQEAGVWKERMDRNEQELEKTSEQLLGVVKLEEILPELRKQLEDGIHNQEELKQFIVQQEALQEEKAKLQEEVPVLEQELQGLIEKEKEAEVALATSRTKLSEAEKHIDEKKKDLKFRNYIDAVAKKEEIQNRIQALDKKFEEIDRKCKNVADSITEIKSYIKNSEEILAQSEAPNLEEERAKKADCEEKRSAFEQNLRRFSTRLQIHKDVRESLVKEAEAISETEKKLQWVKALADTANGKLSGREKIMLETYVQTTYFDRIIRKANLRFLTMSDGQYELVRKKEADNAKSQSGLDLNVLDHYNGTQRSVKTLSGGESFMASLSLALGLSDEVQSAAGGIQIDTLFVDEGFGSLDPEALDQAYRALAGLTEGNRLVGIISHVADLKERIEKQVVVTKQRSGGSKAEIVV